MKHVGGLCQRCQAKVQKNLKEMDKLQVDNGGRLPEYVNMMLAKRLETLTKCLIVLTFILGLLAIAQIILLVM